MTRSLVHAGPASGRRLDYLIGAARRLGLPTPGIVTYRAIADGDIELPPDAWVRIESPDDERAALTACYEAGAATFRETGGQAVVGAGLDSLLERPGWIGNPAQLALGIHALAMRLQGAAGRSGAELSANPQGIALAYDKTACSGALAAAGLPVPRLLPEPADFASLVASMRDEALRRVYVKPRHGAGGGGTVALALGPRGELAAYTATILADDQTVRCTKRMRRLRDHRAIAALIDAMAPLRLHAEAWVPKAAVNGKISDLRLVKIRDRRPCAVLRKGSHTITNLHLDAERSGPESLKRMMGPAWESLEATVDRAFALFPGTQMIGFDVAVTPDLRRHFILEANVFGDHIRNMTFGGLTLQQMQIMDAMEASGDASAA